jgi:hypothetical protein
LNGIINALNTHGENFDQYVRNEEREIEGDKTVMNQYSMGAPSFGQTKSKFIKPTKRKSNKYLDKVTDLFDDEIDTKSDKQKKKIIDTNVSDDEHDNGPNFNLSTTEGFLRDRKNSVVPDWNGAAKGKGILKAKDYIMERWDEDEPPARLPGPKGASEASGLA